MRYIPFLILIKLKKTNNCIQNRSTVIQLPLVPLFLLFNTAGKPNFTWIVLSFFINSYLLLSASFRRAVSCLEYIWFTVTFVLF